MRPALPILATLALAAIASAGYETRVVVRGLERPTGIAVTGNGHFRSLFVTQLPTPGVSGMNGGRNTVDLVRLRDGRIFNLTRGEPEPTNLAFDGWRTLYWTCKSAGVILERNMWTGRVTPLLTNLGSPTGITVGQLGEVYFTQVPTPGVGGSNGGRNTVDVLIQGRQFNLTRGEPEPTDIAADADGNTYWTCKSAGVVLKRTRLGMVSLVAGGLAKPTGIAIDHSGQNLFWTEVPTPGVGGANGGMNKVVRYNLGNGTMSTVNEGDPEPTDISVARDGTLYWTCTSAGVIVEARLRN